MYVENPFSQHFDEIGRMVFTCYFIQFATFYFKKLNNFDSINTEAISKKKKSYARLTLSYAQIKKILHENILKLCFSRVSIYSHNNSFPILLSNSVILSQFL